MNFDEVSSYLRDKNIRPSKLVKFRHDNEMYEFLGLTQESFSATWLAVIKPLSNGNTWKLTTTHFSNIEVLCKL